MKTDKCPCCGAKNFKRTADGKCICEYCNSTFTIEDEENKKQSTTNIFNIFDNNKTNGTTSSKNAKPLKINVVLFVILFFFLPPIAIIYLIAQIAKHASNNTDDK